MTELNKEIMSKFKFKGDSGFYVWDIPPVNGVIYDGDYIWTYQNRKGEPLSHWANEYPEDWQEVFDEVEQSKPLHKDTDLGYFAGLAMKAMIQREHPNSGWSEANSNQCIFIAKELIKQLDEQANKPK